MYKLTRHVPISTRRFILISQRAEGPCSVVLINGERHYSSEQPRRKSNAIRWTLTGATLLTGASIIYAKCNPELRNWIADNAPWAESALTVIFQESKPVSTWASDKFSSTTSTISGWLFGHEGRTVEFPKTGKDPPQVPPSKDYPLPAPALAPVFIEEKKIEKPELTPATKVIKAEPIEIKPQKPVPVTKDIVELEKNVRDNVKAAIEGYMAAMEACDVYIRNISKVIETPIEQLDANSFNTMKAAQKSFHKTVHDAEKSSVAGEQAIKQLNTKLSSNDCGPIEVIHAARRQLIQFTNDLEAAREKFNERHQQTCLADKYWTKVEEARKSYLCELEALFPGVDISKNKLSLENGDPDLLLLHTIRQITHLQTQINEMSTVRDAKIKKAICAHNDKLLIEAAVDQEVAKKKAELEKECQTKLLQVTAEEQRKLREEVKKQIEIHQELLRDQLAAKEKEVKGRFDKIVSEIAESSRVETAEEIAKLKAQLAAIEEKLKARLKAEKESQRAQSLWAAGENLLSSTRRSCDVNKAVQAVEKAAGDDALVKTVVKGISPTTREKGILTENQLREMYEKMEKTALRVALVGKDGAPLPVYFLSYIQSLLLFSKVSAIPQDELDNKPTDFSELDTFDILQRSRYYVARNDLAAGLRYVNLLQGASRTVSDCWREAVVRHLEIKQAAETVMAHASASSVKSG